MFSEYRSSIPEDAVERIADCSGCGPAATQPGSPVRERVEYLVQGEVVGVRGFDENGALWYEIPLRNGKKDGTEYQWYPNGQLVSAEPWVDGLPHGMAKQWSFDGRLMGTYTMDRGTGLDLWREQRDDGSVFLCEVLPWKEGKPEGFEWRINEDQRTVYVERHWNSTGLHGIEREWNNQGRLRRGFPRYHVNNQKVTKRHYLRACETDPTLPPFRAEDNGPVRVFPPEIARHLQPPRSVS